jgi:hypothetical protein
MRLTALLFDPPTRAPYHMLDDSTDGGTPHAKSTIEISDAAKASLASALDDPDMDLAANSQASTKLRCTNFSSSTGNSTDRSVNTKQYAISHKSRTLALATEIRKTAQLEHENREMVCRLQELEALCASGPNQCGAPPPVDSSPNEHLVSPPEPPMEDPPQPLDEGPKAMRDGYDNTIAYDPILLDFQIQENARHALEVYGEPPFESGAEREHATRSYVERHRRAICLGLVIPHLPTDTFDDDDDLWITANRKAALQMAPGNCSYPEIVTFEQVVLANKNWNALLKLHIKYWMNGTMLQSCLNPLLSKGEASAVEFIMSAIDPTTSSRIKKAQSNLPML